MPPWKIPAKILAEKSLVRILTDLAVEGQGGGRMRLLPEAGDVLVDRGERRVDVGGAVDESRTTLDLRHLRTGAAESLRQPTAIGPPPGRISEFARLPRECRRGAGERKRS